jgi:hypothetical protein
MANFVLLNGGRDGIYTVEAPHQNVMFGTFQRIDNFEQQVEDKLDTLSSDIAAIKDMVSMMARAMHFPVND